MQPTRDSSSKRTIKREAIREREKKSDKSSISHELAKKRKKRIKEEKTSYLLSSRVGRRRTIAPEFGKKERTENALAYTRRRWRTEIECKKGGRRNKGGGRRRRRND